MKEKSNNWLEQIYATPEIEIIALQDEQPLMAGSKGKKPKTYQAREEVAKTRRTLLSRDRIIPRRDKEINYST